MALLGRDTTVNGPPPAGVLLLETLSGTEELGAPFAFQLGLLAEDPKIEPSTMLGQPLSVGLKLGTGKMRYFSGVVTTFAKTGTTRMHTRYAASLRPLLSQFGYTSDCRVFNDAGQNAVTIVTSVLGAVPEKGGPELESGSIKEQVLRKREYCVQYQESDLQFVQRLLEEEGIYYFFRHASGKHVMVLAGATNAHRTVEGYETVLYTPKEQQAAGAEEHLWGMTVREELYPGQHTVLSGYDPTLLRAKQPQVGESRSDASAPGATFEQYDYPGGLFDPAEAANEANLRMEADRAERTIVEAEGNTLGLGVGDLVTLRPSLGGGEEVFPFWELDDFASKYLIVRATYSLSVDQYETGTVAGEDQPFRATYQLLDSHIPFRPRRTVQKPRMTGPQTALIVGPAGEEIWTDSEGLGRVMVQFDWDRLGQYNEKSSCWIRVSQVWAGARWGAIHIPRIGQEVIVDFLDGDPDRPVITGRLYNADNMPPYDLPANRTQSGIKSRSSKGGTASNFNEIRFEDKKGQEHLHTQAEKDMSTLVKHCQTLDVGVDRSIVVGNDEDTLIKRNRQTTVNVNDSVVVGGNHDKTVTGDVTQIYGDDHMRKVDGDQLLVAEMNKTEHVKLAYTLTTDERFQLNQDATSMTFEGTNVTLDAAGVIKITAGGAVINVDKAGMVSITSPTGINLVCGGSGISLLPGAIAVAAAAVTAGAAGGASKMEMGDKLVEIKSKTINIEAETVCNIQGKSVLKLNTP
jgi:type VI secretion system secreted protein VgrG